MQIFSKMSNHLSVNFPQKKKIKMLSAEIFTQHAKGYASCRQAIFYQNLYFQILLRF